MRNDFFGAIASKIFGLFYFIFALILNIFALPFVLLKSKNPKYKNALPARFYLKNNPKFNSNGIWFHSCSMGETKALAPLIAKCNDAVSISVVTNTGFEEASKISNDVRFLPFESLLPFWIGKQKVLVVMEAELWYMLFAVAKMHKIKTILINARVSDKSVNSYNRFRFFYKMIFENIDFVFAQSEADKIRLEFLGAKNVEVAGNIKIVNLPKVTRILPKPSTTLICAASTHQNEEDLILRNYDKKYGKLVIVPRHPERFEEVIKICEKFCNDQRLTFARFSESQNFEADVIVFDKMGELINLYAISDVVILGGGFENIGGHNPIEPAFFSTILISGKKIHNQKALFEAVKDYYLIENDELKNCLENLTTLKKSQILQQGNIEKILEVINGKSI